MGGRAAGRPAATENRGADRRVVAVFRSVGRDEIAALHFFFFLFFLFVVVFVLVLVVFIPVVVFFFVLLLVFLAVFLLFFFVLVLVVFVLIFVVIVGGVVRPVFLLFVGQRRPRGRKSQHGCGGARRRLFAG